MKYSTQGICLSDGDMDCVQIDFMCNTCLDSITLTPSEMVDIGTPLCMNEGCEGFDSETELASINILVSIENK